MESLCGNKLKVLAERSKEFALLSGVQMRRAETPSSSELVHHGPFSLFPSKVPQKLLHQAKEAQRDFNLLMHRVAHDHEYMYKCLKNVIPVDEFTGNLWKIHETVRQEGISQPVCLGLFRNDFMMDTGGQEVTDFDKLQLKQIEFNMIASSFGGIVSQLRDVHRYILTQAEIEFNDDNMPINDSVYSLARGMVKAWELYGNPKSYVLFMVDDIERNRMDQLWLEKAVFTINRHCRIIHRSLEYIGRNGVLTDDRKLMVEGKELAVVYYRTGYSPTQFTSQKDWDTRLLIERSTAVKCPPIHYQLAGTKKIQQELAKPGAVEQFLEDPEAIKRVKDTFVGQYSLDKGSEGDSALVKACNQPRNYVVKPQREGGGNNLYDEDIPEFLEKIKDSNERSAYIIMERIFPLVQKNYLIKMGEELFLRNVVNEIGIYGVFIGNESEVLENFEAGHLVRTKNEESNEGGIVVGFSVLDTPYLMTNNEKTWIL